MELPTVFLFACLLVAVYVALGNYLYLAKVLRALDENPSGMPSVQLRQIDRYVACIERAESRPWFYLYLRHIRVVTALVAIALVFGVLVDWSAK